MAEQDSKHHPLDLVIELYKNRNDSRLEAILFWGVALILVLVIAGGVWVYFGPFPPKKFLLSDGSAVVCRRYEETACGYKFEMCDTNMEYACQINVKIPGK